MILIVGLGNPGEKYKGNRHNTGFQFVDFLIEHREFLISNFQFLNNFQNSNNKFQKKFNSYVFYLKADIILAKPQTYMNLSGHPVKKLLKNLKLKIENLVVIHDDLDIPLGKFKIQKVTGPRLHNGIESIEKALGTKDFWRVRIGIDNRTPETWSDGETYVLQDFNSQEKKIINETFPKILGRIKSDLGFGF